MSNTSSFWVLVVCGSAGATSESRWSSESSPAGCCNAAQRASCTSSSSSMVAKCRLTSTVLVSGHRCSAGCSSGEYGGRKSRCTCSGTRRPQAGMPAGAVQHQHNLLVGTGSRCSRKGGQFGFKERNGRHWSPDERRCGPRRDGQSRRHSARRSDAARWLSVAGQSAPTRAAGAVSSRCDVRRWPTVRPWRGERRWRPLLGAVEAFFEGLLLLGIGQGMLRSGPLLTVLEFDQVAPA